MAGCRCHHLGRSRTSKPGTEEIIELPLAEIVWAKTTSDGFAVALTSGRSLRLITGAINAEKMMFAFLGAVAQALGQHGGDVRVPAQRPVLLQGTHQGGYGTGIAVDVPAVLAVDGMSVSVLTPGHGYCRGLDDLLGVQLGGGGEYTTGGGWFGGGFGVQGALEGAALASVMNWLTTRRHMDTVLRLVYADAEATFGVTTHAPGRLELELAALLAWLRGGAAPWASTLGLHALASRSGRSEAPLSGESRFCAGCGEPRQGGGAYCAGCGRPF